ncbi:MAG: glutamine--fructose-6-phosphate transaminase (isomerizing) [Alphaproteobacteria bacterium]|nr:glutamine--fructose-6-phosphate transaminase (isomerizing) [Alphaproteobacteria bacterium]
MSDRNTLARALWRLPLPLRMALLVAGGAAAAWAMPPTAVAPALILLYAPLLLLLAGARGLRAGFALAWAGMFGFHLVGLSWVGEAFLVEADKFGWMEPFAVAGLAAGLALLAGLAGAAFVRLRSGRIGADLALFAALWMTAEWLRGHILTGFPWNLPVQAWDRVPAVLQADAWIGPYALSLLTVLPAAALAALALAPLTRRLSYLDEGDWVVIRGAEAQIYDAANTPVQREIKESAVSGAMIGKGNYRHFMLKEIYEQPAVVGDTLRALFNPSTRAVQMPPLPVDLGRVSRFTINACGTAYYAGLVGKYWLEQVARVPCDVDIASEFRYREAPLPENGVAMCISQSGETVDTLESLRYAKSQGQTIISVVNVPESAIARESHATLATLAGPEIGVASTKAFTTQLTVLAALAIATGVARGSIDGAQAARLTSALLEVPARIAEVLNHDGRIREIALSVAEARDVLYLGRGSSFPIAMEGALKLKEISYIHAEGYAAGEMKHGPIALIDDSVPVVFIAPGDPLFEKTASNLHEVVARGGKPILFADRKGIAKVGAHAVHAIEMPEIDPFVAPILYAIPVQLLAYHAAVAKGTDVDQPRNLAKSVTVE